MERIRALNRTREAGVAKSKRPPIAAGADGISGTETDLRALASTIIHHDAEIVNLSARMTGVEASVQTLSKDQTVGFSKVHQTINDRFAALTQAINDQKAQQGPGWGPILGGGSAVVAILGGITYAISLLVQSSVSPTMTKVEADMRHVQGLIRNAEAGERAELLQHRRDRKDQIDKHMEMMAQRLDALSEKLQWTGRVERHK